MGNTYTKIAETKNEWQRQWARIVLVVERGVAPHDRLKKFNDYCQLMADGRPSLILRLNMTVCGANLRDSRVAKVPCFPPVAGRREDRDEGHPRDEARPREDGQQAAGRARSASPTTRSRSPEGTRDEGERATLRERLKSRNFVPTFEANKTFNLFSLFERARIDSGIFHSARERLWNRKQEKFCFSLRPDSGRLHGITVRHRFTFGEKAAGPGGGGRNLTSCQVGVTLSRSILDPPKRPAIFRPTTFVRNFFLFLQTISSAASALISLFTRIASAFCFIVFVRGARSLADCRQGGKRSVSHHYNRRTQPLARIVFSSPRECIFKPTQLIGEERSGVLTLSDPLESAVC